MDPASLDDVLRRACRREPEALSLLVKSYSKRVFGLLYQLTGSRDAAEDLLQETFLRVVRTIDQYEHGGKFESWLFRIAGNLARDRARQYRRRGPTVELGAPDDDGQLKSPPVGGGPDGPEQRLIGAESSARLDAAMRQLSGPEREILVLRHSCELSFREIAEMLDVPLGTALARAHRALGRLKDEINRQES